MLQTFIGAFQRRAAVAGGTLLASVAVAAAVFPSMVAAAPSAQQMAVVRVACDDRVGTGALTSLNDGGYVLTAGHVVSDVYSGNAASECVVGFVQDDSLYPTLRYRAAVVQSAFDERLNRDYAVLRLTEKLSGSGSLPAPMLANEFAAEGERVTAYGFADGGEVMRSVSGALTGFRRGKIFSDAPIVQGYSGGPVTDSSGRLIGIAQRLNFIQDSDTGVQRVVDHDIGDILAVIAWMDTLGPSLHDRYLTHADPSRFDGSHAVIRRESSGCLHLVHAPGSQSVFCLLSGPYRLVFPTESSFYSWYPNFSELKHVSAANVAEYQLIGTVTLRAGSLVKIRTDPKVYVVTDSIGTIRWVPTEQLATEMFGANWAKQVRDVPVEFFNDYRIADPVR